MEPPPEAAVHPRAVRYQSGYASHRWFQRDSNPAPFPAFGPPRALSRSLTARGNVAVEFRCSLSFINPSYKYNFIFIHRPWNASESFYLYAILTPFHSATTM